MEEQNIELALMLKALGEPTRLRIYHHLMSCRGEAAMVSDGVVRDVTGVTVSEICCCIFPDSKPTTSMSFHLKELRNAGLIRMERRGKFQVCSLVPEALELLQEFFQQPCLESSNHLNSAMIGCATNEIAPSNMTRR